MAKKTTYEALAIIQLLEPDNKAAAWLGTFVVRNLDTNELTVTSTSAWKNASAAKRWVKARVLEHTPRKSVKMESSGSVNALGKPFSFSGTLQFKG